MNGESDAEQALVSATTRAFYKIAKAAPKGYRAGLAKDLYQAQMRYLPEEWIAYSIGLAIFAFALFLPLLHPLFSALSISLTALFASALAISSLTLCLNLSQPARAKREYSREFEADMAIGIQALAIELNSGKRVAEAIRSISEADHAHFSKLLGMILKQQSAGEKMPDAIDKAAASIDSQYARRLAALLKNAYSISKGENLGNPFLSLSDELIRNNEAELREYTAKSGLFSQGATVLTIVLPTMLVSLALVGAIFSKAGANPKALTIAVGFGISAMASLLYIIQARSLPVFVRRLGNPSDEGYAELTMSRLHMLGLRPRRYLAEGAAGALLLVSAASIASAALSAGHALPIATGFFSMLFLAYWPHLQFSRMQKEIEDELPQALEEAAQLMPHSRSERIVQAIAGLGVGKLSEEFAKAERELKAGARLEEAIEKIYRDTGSQYLRQAMMLFVRSHKTGLDTRKALLNTADYTRKIKYIMQESKAATFSERATQALGYLISAAMFAMVVSLGAGLSKALTGTLFSVDPAMIQAIATGIQIDLLLHPLVIAWNISALENDRKRAMIYAPMLLALGNLLFLSLKDLPLI